MAARTVSVNHHAEVRAKIRTSQLLNRLQNHAFGEIELSVTQIKAIEILLKKSLPDLSAVTITGDPSNPIVLMWRDGQSSSITSLGHSS